MFSKTFMKAPGRSMQFNLQLGYHCFVQHAKNVDLKEGMLLNSTKFINDLEIVRY